MQKSEYETRDLGQNWKS